MRTKLALVAVAGFTISALCLGGAFALGGGNAVEGAVFNFGGFGAPGCPAAGPSAAIASRTLPWSGTGDLAAVELPANAYYRPGSGDQLVVKGDPGIISHVFVRDGVVGIDCNLGGFFFGQREPRLEVTLPGRAFHTFELRGSGDMKLAGLSQPEAQIALKGSGDITADGKFDRLKVLLAGSGNITAAGSTGSLDLDVRGSGDAKLGGLIAKSANVDIEGSGDVEIAPRDASTVDITGEGSGGVKAEGTTDTLKVDIGGSGEAKLGRLAAKNADVHIAGSGEAEVAPEESLRAGIVGSGDIYLRREPKKIEASIAGSGELVHSDGTRQDRRSLERHARADDVDIRPAVASATAREENADAHLERAQAELSAKIKEHVARELEKAGLDTDR